VGLYASNPVGICPTLISTPQINPGPILAQRLRIRQLLIFTPNKSCHSPGSAAWVAKLSIPKETRNRPTLTFCFTQRPGPGWCTNSGGTPRCSKWSPRSGTSRARSRGGISCGPQEKDEGKGRARTQWRSTKNAPGGVRPL